MSKGQDVVDLAMSQVGIHESPWGSNCGGSEKYQAMYAYLGKCGWPWCGAFVGWCWEQIVAGSKQYSDPSTATMCDVKPNVSAQPGAAFVICGTHTGLLRYKVSGSVWATVEGNHGDQVACDTRDISGMQIVGPPWLGEGTTPKTTTWYFLQDVTQANNRGQHDYYGGWTSDSARNKPYNSLKKTLGHELRKFKDPDFPSAYFLDNTSFMNNHGGLEVYGGWSSKSSRDDSQKTLEARLGRTLRAFSETRTPEQGGVPWRCQNLQDVS
jgi:hypothetical protein